MKSVKRYFTHTPLYYMTAEGLKEYPPRVNWRARQLETVRQRAGGRMTATEVLLASHASDRAVEALQETLWMLPALCGPFGRIMP